MENAYLLVGEGCSGVCHHILYAALVHGKNVGIAFHHEYAVLLVDGLLGLEEAVQFAAFGVYGALRRVHENADQWKDFGTFVEYVSPAIKTAAIAAVNAKISESDNDNVKAIATNAATAINAATTVAEINALKTLAIAAIASAKAAYGDGEAAGYNTGYEEGEAAVRAELPTEGTSGPAVIITKGDKSITLLNPEEVEYKIISQQK